ncbi:MAG: hypothetical protein K9N51_12935, partial [Candidatus Pacebacteria bacterium]|nr:hypothetical protein [Candidatus Paceibacterota bacterium]
TSFGVPKLCYLLKHRGNAMPDALHDKALAVLDKARIALNGHRCTWGYTNIHLLNIAAKLMVADVMDDARMRAIACWDWEEWRNHTARLGMITEYNSPPYTRVQIDALAMILTTDAPEALLREVRAAMRHLITDAVLNYHPGVGMLTGPMSRAYEGNRRTGGNAGIYALLKRVLGTPGAEDEWGLWLGVPVGPEDLLPMGRDLALPRQTSESTPDFSRTNYLDKRFALGSVTGSARLFGHEVPFLLAYKNDTSKRCSIPVMVENRTNSVHGHWSQQHEGNLLTASVWLVETQPAFETQQRNDRRGSLTRLWSGQPGDLNRNADFQPGYRLELGAPDDVDLYTEEGKITPGGQIAEPVLIVRTRSVLAGFRFFGASGTPASLVIDAEEDGEMILHATAEKSGVRVSELETAVFCGMFMRVVDLSEVNDPMQLVREMSDAAIEVDVKDFGWNVRASASNAAWLDVAARTDVPSFYSADGKACTANQWSLSLSS